MHSIAEKMRLSEPVITIWIKIDPHSKPQKCSPMTLLSGDIRFMQIYAGVPWSGCQTTVELSTTAIFSVFAGYFSGNFRDKASILWQWYAVRRRLFTDPKMRDLEWPWMAVCVFAPVCLALTMRFSKIIAWKLIKINSYVSGENLRDRETHSLSSRPIRFVWIFAQVLYFLHTYCRVCLHTWPESLCRTCLYHVTSGDVRKRTVIRRIFGIRRTTACRSFVDATSSEP